MPKLLTCITKNSTNCLMPLFSIVIPVFNMASLIESTLESVYNQKLLDFEVIIVDDGSSDELSHILEKYIEQKGLIYFYQFNNGVSSARNRGVLMAKGEYIVFLDSDDKVTHTWLYDYANVIKESNPDIVYCGINRIKDDKLVEYTDPKDPYKNGIDFGNVIPGSFCLKKSFFELIGGYDEKLAYGENTELGFRIKYANPSKAFIISPNLLYSMLENSHGKNARNKMNAMIYTIQKHPHLFNENKGMKRRFLSIAGVAAVQSKEYKKSKELLFAAWKIDPLNLNLFLRFMCSISPLLSKRIWGV